MEKLHSLKHNWFYSHGSYNYVVYNYSYTDSSGNSQNDFLKIYLLNKSEFAKSNPELASSLRGGDAEGNSDTAYLNFKDVYGVTSNLHVFYCSDGLASCVGADFKDASKFDSTKTIYANTTNIAKAVANTYGSTSKDLNLNDLYSVKELTISGNDGFADLSSLYELPSLKKLTLKNFNGSLSGIEYANKLTYLYFDNSGGTQNISSYAGLSKINSLTELYFLNPTNTEVNNLILEMRKMDYPNLKTVGFYGRMDDYEYPTCPAIYPSSPRSSFSKGEYINNFSEITKKAIKILYIQNNSLTSLSGIENLTNVESILAQNNLLTDITALKSLTSIKNLKLYNNTNLDSISDIFKLNNLKFLSLVNDNKITTIKDTITNNKKLDTLYATGLESLDFAEDSQFWTVDNKNKLGSIAILELSSKYSLLFSNNSVMKIDSSITDAQFETLINNSYIKELYLNNNKAITDKTIQKVLPTLPNLEKLEVENTNISSLDWCSTAKCKNKLLNLDIMNTNLTDIINLNNFSKLSTVKTNGDKLILYKEKDLEFTKASTQIVNEICKRTLISSMNGGLGFWPGSVHMCSEISKLDGLEYFGFYNGGELLADIDLSNSKLKVLKPVIYYSGTKKIKLPKTTEIIDAHCGAHLELDSDISLKNIYFTWSGDVLEIDKFEATDGQYELEICGNDFGEISKYSNLLTSKVKKMEFFTSNYIERNKQRNKVDTSYLKKLTSCQSFYFSNVTFSNFDGGDIPSSVTSLIIDNCNLSGVPNIEKATGLTDLQLQNNRLSSLEDFYKLGESEYLDTCKLESLNLQNNTLQNYTSIKDLNKSFSTDSILTRIKTLKTIKLSGNKDLTSYSSLTTSRFYR